MGGLEAAEASNSKKGSSPESSQRNSVSSESEDPGCSDSEDQISAPSLTSTRCLKRLCALGEYSILAKNLNNFDPLKYKLNNLTDT